MATHKITTLAALALGLALPAAAKTKTPPAYHTATLTVWTAHHDSSASVTVHGHTSTLGCNYDGANVDCDDSTGGFILKFDDGSLATFGGIVPLDPESIVSITHPAMLHRPCVSIVPAPKECDPLAPLEQQVLLDSSHKPVTFQFHWEIPAKYDMWSDRSPLLCMDFTYPDKHGKPEPHTACYAVTPHHSGDPAYDALSASASR